MSERSSQNIVREIDAARNGLSQKEVAARLVQWGRNALPRERPLGALRLFIRQFTNPIGYILIFAAAVTFTIGHLVDGFFISVVVIANGLLGFIQERKAQTALIALRKFAKTEAVVLRDGSWRVIDAEDMVVGDIIAVRLGAKVPADARLIEAHALKTNEAALTGESDVVQKKIDPVPEDAPLYSRTNMLWLGTTVAEGEGTACVTATGAATEFGKIVGAVRNIEEPPTPLQKKLAELARLVGVLVLGFALIVFILGFLRGLPLFEMFLSAVALSVSAIPAGLLPGITIVLVFGMRRLVKRQALVRRLIANETLGAVTVICTDKTGTITTGQMRVTNILTTFAELLHDSDRAKNNHHASHLKALTAIVQTSSAFIENPDSARDHLIIHGSPTEQALLRAATEAGIDWQKINARRVDHLPFDSSRKMSIALMRTDGDYVLEVVGAPDFLIPSCNRIDYNGGSKPFTAEYTGKILRRFEELTAEGYRVVLAAHRHLKERPRRGELLNAVRELTLIGFIALTDPVRPDARQALIQTARAGVRTVLVTGDHKNTALAVALRAGLTVSAEEAIEGQALDQMSDAELRERVRSITLYARVSPLHKLRIVRALRENGEVVAMIGDGVNDAPALKSAHVGVALGSGTEAAKEVADIVLLDDNFHTLVNAIGQGRAMFRTIQKIFIFLLADDFAEIALFLAAMIAGWPLPLLPTQILWINVIEDSLPNMALTTEHDTKGVMEEPPRRLSDPIIDGRMGSFMGVTFLVSAAVVIGLFWQLNAGGVALSETRSIVFAVAALDSLIYAYSIRSLPRAIFNRDIFGNRYLNFAVVGGILLLMAAIYFPPLTQILGVVPLTVSAWGWILLIVAVEITIIEAAKRIFLGKYRSVGVKGAI